MRTIVVGLGVQGQKRARIAGRDLVATVDPVVAGATFAHLSEVPLSSYDAALVCTPDGAKLSALNWLLSHHKHVLVEKPLACGASSIQQLAQLAAASQAACYTAYNHRFEPHLVTVRELLKTERIGRLHSLSVYYGNGTARDVRNSPWRDVGLGVISDLGSHMLDLIDFWVGAADPNDESHAQVLAAHRFENEAFDAFTLLLPGYAHVVRLEGTLLSWRNTFRFEAIGERGSIHVDGLCKWGPSVLTVRDRILPSGKPRETVEVLEQADPTWKAEYQHFSRLCSAGDGTSDLSADIAISNTLNSIAAQLNVVGWK